MDPKYFRKKSPVIPPIKPEDELKPNFKSKPPRDLEYIVRKYYVIPSFSQRIKVSFYFFLFKDFSRRVIKRTCSMADGISFDVSLSLNCTDLYKRGGGA